MLTFFHPPSMITLSFWFLLIRLVLGILRSRRASHTSMLTPSKLSGLIFGGCTGCMISRMPLLVVPNSSQRPLSNSVAHTLTPSLILVVLCLPRAASPLPSFFVSPVPSSFQASIAAARGLLFPAPYTQPQLTPVSSLTPA